ncbi:unnamed protein product [Diamesa serratosioi]
MGALLGKLTIANTPVVVSTAARSFVKDTMQQQRVVIFSKSTCPYCTMAKEQFQKLKVDFLAIELDRRSDGGEVQDALKELTGARSVPRVFVDGNFIGGGTDVKKMYEDGSLAKLLA